MKKRQENGKGVEKLKGGKIITRTKDYIMIREPYSTEYTLIKKTKKIVCIREPYTHNFTVFI